MPLQSFGWLNAPLLLPFPDCCCNAVPDFAGPLREVGKAGGGETQNVSAMGCTYDEGQPIQVFLNQQMIVSTCNAYAIIPFSSIRIWTRLIAIVDGSRCSATFSQPMCRSPSFNVALRSLKRYYQQPRRCHSLHLVQSPTHQPVGSVLQSTDHRPTYQCLGLTSPLHLTILQLRVC